MKRTIVIESENVRLVLEIDHDLSVFNVLTLQPEVVADSFGRLYEVLAECFARKLTAITQMGEAATVGIEIVSRCLHDAGNEMLDVVEDLDSGAQTILSLSMAANKRLDETLAADMRLTDNNFSSTISDLDMDDL